MPAQITKIGIINRGLQLLGQPPISSLSENSRGAKAMAVAYDMIFLRELTENNWNFSIKRASLPASAVPPIFGKPRYFPLPGDFLKLAPDETTFDFGNRHDYNIEGGSIVTSEQGPLPIRYVSSSVTESDFDALFAEALAASLALATCEDITNSNAKKQDARVHRKEQLDSARKVNSMQNSPVKQSIPTWIAVRT